jgi:hypothetical protein
MLSVSKIWETPPIGDSRRFESPFARLRPDHRRFYQPHRPRTGIARLRRPEPHRTALGPGFASNADNWRSAPAVLFAVIFAVEIAIILYAAPALDPLAPLYVT